MSLTVLYNMSMREWLAIFLKMKCACFFTFFFYDNNNKNNKGPAHCAKIISCYAKDGYIDARMERTRRIVIHG